MISITQKGFRDHGGLPNPQYTANNLQVLSSDSMYLLQAHHHPPVVLQGSTTKTQTVLLLARFTVGCQYAFMQISVVEIRGPETLQ